MQPSHKQAERLKRNKFVSFTLRRKHIPSRRQVINVPGCKQAVGNRVPMTSANEIPPTGVNLRIDHGEHGDPPFLGCKFLFLEVGISYWIGLLGLSLVGYFCVVLCVLVCSQSREIIASTCSLPCFMPFFLVSIIHFLCLILFVCAWGLGPQFANGTLDGRRGRHAELPSSLPTECFITISFLGLFLLQSK